MAASAASLRATGAALFGDRLMFFPIRHHSPACAFHLRHLIRERRPTHVLIEGPASFDQFVDLLAHSATKPPVAIYSYCTEQLDGAAESEDANEKRRRGAYYPFCEYSPEWVAIREGVALGAEIRFIDLDFPKQVVADRSDRLSGRLSSFLWEQHFERSAYLRQLAAERGCRNHDELWDRLFEAWGPRVPSEEFVTQVAAYCDLSRRGVSEAEHAYDATFAREAEMAWHIRQVLGSGSRAKSTGTGARILVVTGGYHTVVLPHLIERAVERPKIDTGRVRDPGAVLIRYSFDRLDRLRGYGAGMPSPAYYQRVWERSQDSQPGTDVALELITDVAHRARMVDLDQAPTAATLIAAAEHVQRLAQLRGNPEPTRDDVLDALVSCFVKGAVDGEGRAILKLAVDTMTGSAVGEIPPEAGQPPIATDFYAQARKLRLKVNDSDIKKLSLDVYRDTRDRDVSRFLHVLQFLEISFATRLAGPQFTAAKLGRRLLEQWEYSWSPQTESGLVEAASYGGTVREAAGNKFLEELRKAQDQDRNRSAAQAVEWLSQACLFGLHELTGTVLTWMRRCVREDPSVPSAVGGLSGLVLLWETREPLGAEGLESVPALARTCFERLAYLSGEAHLCGDAEAVSVAEALVEMRNAATGSCADWFDAAMLWDAIGRLAAHQPCQPTVAGAAAGLLYSTGRWSEQELSNALRGQLVGRPQAKTAMAFVRGLALAAREAFWQSDAVLGVLRDVVEEAEDREFLKLLPELRLALSVLTPRETDQLGQRIAGALGVKSLETSVAYGIEPAEVQRNLEIAQQLREVLMRDGLTEWIENERG